jgi:hypothetical protein
MLYCLLYYTTAMDYYEIAVVLMWGRMLLKEITFLGVVDVSIELRS